MSAALDGQRPAQTPEVILSGGVGWGSEGRSASVEISRVGSQYEDELNRNLLPGATTIDAFASWPLGDKLQLIARGQNLSDETVTAALNDDGSVERATPRTVWLGLRFSSR